MAEYTGTETPSRLTRRSLIRGGGLSLVGATVLPSFLRAQTRRNQTQTSTAPAISPAMMKLSTYMSKAKDQPLPPEVVDKAKQHILDTIAAMVSGSSLLPGVQALKFARAYGGKPVATVVASDIVCGPIEAAMANGMLAHSDETDDSHAPSQSHPGCAIVPAALAAGERFEVSGTEFIRSVTLGYDVGTRITMTLGAEPYENSSHRSTHNIANTFGSSAAAACAAGLTVRQMRWVLNYAAEQASGLALWDRDPDHIEKAFDFAGGPARDGVTSAMVVQSGWTGLDDVFSGPNNFFLAFNPNANPAGIADQLGTRFEVARTDIKRWSVGMPIQAPLEALLNIRKAHPFTLDQVKEIDVRLAPQEGAIVNNRALPDICLQHLMALMLVDGKITFKSSHDRARMQDPAILKQRAKVKLVPDEALGKLMPHRQSTVEVTLTNGQTYRDHVGDVLGMVSNPMTDDQVKGKARDLMTFILGKDASSRLIDRIYTLESVKDIRELRPLLQKTS